METNPERVWAVEGLLTRILHYAATTSCGESDMTRSAAKAALTIVFGLSLLAGGACSRTQQYMATGGGLGAAGGAVVAAATGGTVLGGAVVGGAIGTGAGYIASR
jgi:osmotically inducible lipoprotein OsmB